MNHKQLLDRAYDCLIEIYGGNQALIEPMSLEEKVEFFKLLVQVGFKEIEVGFPAASETEYTFMRRLIDDGLIPFLGQFLEGCCSADGVCHIGYHRVGFSGKPLLCWLHWEQYPKLGLHSCPDYQPHRHCLSEGPSGKDFLPIGRRH